MVFFRAETLRTALDLGLAGWVRNMEDGRVESLFEGEDASVDRMLAWCRQGPPHARVESVEMTEESWKGDLRGFRIKDF
jgi:acylphosphatase